MNGEDCSGSEEDSEGKYVPELIIGARHVRGVPVYQVKWKDCPHSLDCDGDIEDPAELIHANGHKLERGRVVVRYKVGVAPQEGIPFWNTVVPCLNTLLNMMMG